MLLAQFDLPLYLVQCPHRSEITDDCVWCPECGAWIDGTEVGDIQVFWEESGRILVEGGGYAPHTEAK